MPSSSPIFPDCSYSNLVLTDGGKRIISCARQVSAKMSSKRSLQTGAPYSFPPAQSTRLPSLAESLEALRENVAAVDPAKDGTPLPLATALTRAYQVQLRSQLLPRLCALRTTMESENSDSKDFVTGNLWGER